MKLLTKLSKTILTYFSAGLIVGAVIFGALNAFGASVFFPYQGGTGTSTVPSSGKILIGNASGTYSPNYLTAGSNVTISTSSGAITINSTASGSGSVSTSSAPTAYNFPYWANTTGGLNGTSTLFYASSTGYIGIGTTNPGYELDVTGAIRQTSATSSYAYFDSNGKLVTTSTPLLAVIADSPLSGSGTSASHLIFTNPGYITSSTGNGLYLQIANNGSDITSTSTFRTNLGLGVFATQSAPCTIAQGCLATTTTPSADSYLVGDGTNYQFKKFVAGTNITIATSSTSTTISSTGGSPGGSDTYVQYNNGGSFGGDSNFTYTSSTASLSVGIPQIPSFSYTGSVQSWTVPTGVTSITISVQGAVGGTGETGRTGGNGGKSIGTLSVTPGTTYYYCIGQSGSRTVVGSTFCGGGSQGTGGGGQSGSGGGMTWFGTQNTFSTSSVLLVAAGGGGGGADGGVTGGNGGNGGGTTGSSGGNGTVGTGGGGGTQSTGGGAGSPSGNAGTVGQGGAGGNGTQNGGGGGGGGYYGGGGGGSGGSGSSWGAGGGGGGSSFIASSLTSTSTTAGTNNATGTLSITIANQGTQSLFGHIVSGGGLPTQSSCGTSPSSVGNDTAGVITTGSGTVNSCTLTFNNAYTTNAPICVANTAATSTQVVINSVSTLSVTFNFSASYPSSKVYYHCLGY